MSDLANLPDPTEPDTRTVHQRMAAAFADVTAIAKQSAEKVNYQFRSVDAVMNALHPILAAHGLFPSPRVLDDWQVNQIPGTNNRMQTQALFRIAVDMYGANGDTVTLGPGLAQSHDYGDKAVYQAQQNALKYVLIEAFCIPTQEEDQDARPADDVPAADLRALEASIARAEALGVQGQWDRARDVAKHSQEHADKTVAQVERRILKWQQEQDAESPATAPGPAGGTDAPAETPGTESDDQGDGVELITAAQQTQLREAAKEAGWSTAKLKERAQALAIGEGGTPPESLAGVTVTVAAELFADLQEAKENG